MLTASIAGPTTVSRLAQLVPGSSTWSKSKGFLQCGPQGSTVLGKQVVATSGCQGSGARVVAAVQTTPAKGMGYSARNPLYVTLTR